MARTPKLDAVLAGSVDAAREALLELVPAEQLGGHVGAFADGERLVTHRFSAQLDAYAGWEWYATLARLPRGKAPTVSEVGLLPGADALLAPPWVPWSDRVNEEEMAAAREAEEAAAREAADAQDTPDAQDKPAASDAGRAE
ncbi:DUF3027 domain-containing protein [Arthrobacter sp. KK5.5]|uniref:DUF3027 domain-containing protein n=1 Tax=Arthrobacter sp. KK5.5 TaxID=3373084 RepID=UPI003EE4280B